MTPARQLWTVFEPLHAVTYFSAEGRAALEGVGLRGFWRGYFASRVAPLGRTEPAVVTALFGGFAPRMVERAIPSVWELASPERSLEARLEGSAAALARLLEGQDEAVTESADLLRTVATAAATGGRALGAANAALPWPTAPHQVLWQASTVLRELRGDGHVLAQLTVGLDGLTTMVLRTGLDLTREVLQPNRGWPDEEWVAALAELVDRGLLSADGAITAAGRDLLTRAEALTDELATQPWTAAGPEVTERFRTLAAPLAQLALAELPPITPIGLPAP